MWTTAKLYNKAQEQIGVGRWDHKKYAAHEHKYGELWAVMFYSYMVFITNLNWNSA